MLNKIAYALSVLFPVLMAACSGNDVAGGTIDPNTIAEKSSDSKEVSDASSSSEKASVWSSSSNAVVTPTFSSSELSDAMSSSSEEVDVTVFPRARNFSIQCVEDVVYVDLNAPAVTPDVGEPVAYKRVEGDSVNLSLQNVYFDIPCDAEKQKVFMDEVNSDNPIVNIEIDTLYVNFPRSKEMVYDCSCAANASFSLDKVYSYFNYTVFDQKQPILVQTP